MTSTSSDIIGNCIRSIIYMPSKTANVNTIYIDPCFCGFACRQQDIFCISLYLAVEATKECDVDMSGEFTEPFRDVVWVTKSVYDENGEVNGTPYLSDLGAALKAAIHRNKHLGQSNQDTIYFRASRDIAQHMVADIRNGYWEEKDKVSDAMLKKRNKGKTGLLWHKGKPYLWKMPSMRRSPATDNLCPLCGQPDPGSHILGDCAHPEMRKMV